LIAAASLLLGVTIQFVGVSSAHSRVFTEAYTSAENRTKTVQTNASKLKSDTESAKSAFNKVDAIGKQLTSNVEGRVTWLEMLRAVNAALPQAQPGAEVLPLGQRPPFTSDSFAKVDRVFITSVEAVSENLTTWFAPFKADNRYYPDDEELGSAPAGGTPATSDVASSEEGQPAVQNSPSMTDEERFAKVTGPTGTGPAKVVQITGYHYHNPSDVNEAAEDGGEAYLRKTLLRNLKFVEVELPTTIEEQNAGIMSKKVKMSELGISYPVLLYVPSIEVQRIVNPDLEPLPPDIAIPPDMLTGGAGVGASAPPMGRTPNVGTTRGGAAPATGPQQRTLQQYAQSRGVNTPILNVRRFDFQIQFAWEETPPSQRKLKEESSTPASTAGGTQ
jgi:hypothetical protein